MKIERKKLSDLNPSGYNPRKISDAALAGLAASIARWGIVEPIIFNARTSNVVGGHQRLRVLVQQGVVETDCVVVDLPESEEKALNVSLNNKSIQGEFSGDLPELIAEFTADIPDLDPALQFEADTSDFADTPIPLPDGNRYQEQYGVICICSDEATQKACFEALKAQGYECRIVVT